MVYQRQYQCLSIVGVRVIGVATAFEDYDKNFCKDRMAKTGEVVGDTKRGLGDYGRN